MEASPNESVTPQSLYNTIAGVLAYFGVSNPIRVIKRVKCIDIQQILSSWGLTMISVISKTMM